jgi:hypothetical protein
MEIFSTIITGVIVYVLGQFTLKIIIEPIQELKKEIQQTLADCSYYAGLATNMPDINEEKALEARKIFRQRSTYIRSKYKIIPFMDTFAVFGIIPVEKSLSEASSMLMGLSNTISSSGNFKENMQNNEWLKEIENLLAPKSEGLSK